MSAHLLLVARKGLTSPRASIKTRNLAELPETGHGLPEKVQPRRKAACNAMPVTP